MKRFHARLFAFFAFSLLAFAIYLNLFYKEDSKPAVHQDTEVQKTNDAKLKENVKKKITEKKADQN